METANLVDDHLDFEVMEELPDCTRLLSHIRSLVACRAPLLHAQTLLY